MKKKHLDKKKRSGVRKRDWAHDHENAFSHDLVKHRRALAKLPESVLEGAPLPKDFTPNGLVVSHAKKWAFVQIDGVERTCLIDERLQERDSTLLAPGDRVLVEFEDEDAIVRGVAPRRTRLCRPGGEHARLAEQVIAANVDALIVVASAARPAFREGLIDRFLIAAQIGGVQPLLCVNKMDLADAEPPAVQTYRDLGIRVFLTSCVSSLGLSELREALAEKLAVLAGHSGVGKSSLLNALDPSLDIDTQEISNATERGKHTTTAGRLHTLHGGIRIIDTPGIRALGLWGVSPPEVAYYFPEIGEVCTACKFRDCTHVHEPGCAVRDAVAEGIIPLARFNSYLRIRASLESATGITPGRISPGLNPR